MRPSRVLIGLGVLVLLGLAAVLLLLPAAPEAGPTPRPGQGAGGPRPRSTAPVAAAPRTVEPGPGPEAAAPAPPEPGATTSPAPARATFDASRVSLRGVTGVVVDAVTGAPIEGAWVTWRPLNQELLATVLDPTAQAGGGILTGKDGRFVLPRLANGEPPAALLRAVAPGRAPAAVAPGLAEEVRLELHPAGSLRVTVVGGDGAAVTLRAVSVGRDVDRSFVEEDPPDGKGEPPVFRFLRLAPGTWAVELDRIERARVAIEPGRETALELSAPERWPVVVRLGGVPAGSAWFELQLVQGEGATERRCSLPARKEEAGTFAGSPRPGPYRLVAVFGANLSALDAKQGSVELGRIEGPGEHLVAFPPHLTVRLETQPEGPSILLALEHEHLFMAEPGEELALVPARYALFRQTAFKNTTPPQFLGELDLTGPPPVVTVAPRLVPASLTFALPEGLHETEALRARLSLIPACLVGAADRVAEHLDRQVLIRAADPRVDLGPILPGTYLVRGTTDLGPFEATLELPGGAVINLR